MHAEILFPTRTFYDCSRTHTQSQTDLSVISAACAFMSHRQYLSKMAFLWLNFRLPCRPPVHGNNNDNNNKSSAYCIFSSTSPLAPLVVVVVILVNVVPHDSSAELALLSPPPLHAVTVTPCPRSDASLPSVGSGSSSSSALCLPFRHFVVVFGIAFQS